MLKTTKNITISGRSTVADNGAEAIIGYFNATISEDGNINLSSSIANRELYEANKSEFRTDRDEFNSLVDTLVDSEG